MAEFKTSLAPEQPAETMTYSPLSGLAIASVAIAAVYALVVSVLTATALWSGDPLPLGMASLLVPATSAILALLARRQIRRAEGTRSGAALATWGWWLSLGFGLAYAGFYIGTYLAVSYQAENFAQRFFDEIRNGKVNNAFLRTQDPEQRQDVNPDNQQLMTIRFGTAQGGNRKAPLPQFQASEMVRLLQVAGKDAVVRDLGVSDWNYDKGYHIVRSYRLSTPEGDADVTLSLRSSEAKKARGWRIVPVESDMSASKFRPTPLGDALKKWRDSSRSFAFVWLAKRGAGALDLAYLETLDPAESTRLLRVYQASTLSADLAAIAGALTAAGRDSYLGYVGTLADRELRWKGYLPGFAAFAAGGLVRADKLEAPPKLRDEIVKESKHLFTPGSRIMLKPSEGAAGVPQPFDAAAKRLRVVFNIDMDSIDPAAASEGRAFHCEAQLVVESDPGELTAQRMPQWHVVGLNLLSGDEPAADPRNPAQAGGQRGPRNIRAVEIRD